MIDHFIEEPEKDYSQKFKISKKFFSGRTKFQDVQVLESIYFGRILILDGVVQLSEKDEFVYHEMLAHVPIFAHGQAKDILVIGGGDGGILREILRHQHVERIVQVEIDGEVVDICKEFLPQISKGAFDSDRVETIISDGFQFLKETDKTFDIIINDSTDPEGPGEVLFTEDFFKLCHNCLKEGGIFVNQNGVAYAMFEEIISTSKHLQKTFKDWSFYSAHIPVYIGGPTMFAWGSDDISLRTISEETLIQRYGEAGIETKYYSPEIHKASFVMNKLLKDSIGLLNE